MKKTVLHKTDILRVIIFWLGLIAYSTKVLATSTPDVALITQPVFMCGSGGGYPFAERPSFESIPSRPLALSNDGSMLFAVNTIANCLEIFDVRDKEIKLLSTVSVGVDPVAVQVRNNTEVWVVNHLSDSISIVNINGRPRVINTLQTGDEPWDIVFADNQKNRLKGDSNRKNRAYVSAAYRGQFHPQFKTQYLNQNRLNTDKHQNGELIGRADLWVYDISDQDAQPVLSGIINLFTASIRSLAVNRDGSRVFAASFKSGNRTAAIDVGFDDLQGNQWSSDGVGNPEPRVIVQQKEKKWLDENGRDWSGKMEVNVADNDLFVIDSSSEVRLGNRDQPFFNRHAIIKKIESIGTILFNVETSGDYVFISGIDANNIISTEDKLKGKFVNNLIATVDMKNNYSINIKYLDNLQVVDGSGMHDIGAALPAGMAYGEGSLYLTTMGGNNILKVDPDSIFKSEKIMAQDAVDFSNNKQGKIKGGPIGVQLDSLHKRLFVYTKFDNKVSMYSLGQGENKLISSYEMQDGEKENIKQGRQYFYDANLVSAKGNVACASCHIFGGSDKLQWDLGQADRPMVMNELPYIPHPDPAVGNLKTTIRTIKLNANPDTIKTGDTIKIADNDIPVQFKGNKQDFADLIDSGAIDFKKPGLVYLSGNGDEKRLYKYNMASVDNTWALIDVPFFHPLKGPMLTLPLYGVADSGPMHFRGDMQGREQQGGKECPQGDSTEERALKEFNAPCDGSAGTFENLLAGKKLDDTHMQSLADFILSLTYPPNPVRPLNNSYVNDNGADIFFNDKTMADVMDYQKLTNKGPLVFRCADCHVVDRSNREFGTAKIMYSAPSLTRQDAKIPHLRFLYDRVGYYSNLGPDKKYDEDINAAGFNHGGIFNMNMFHYSYVWILGKYPVHAKKDPTANDYVELFEFLMGFDTNLFPMYGRQITLASNTKNDEAIVELKAFNQYIENIYSPVNLSEPQCAVHFDIAGDKGIVEHRVINKNEISGPDGNVSSHLVLKLADAVKTSSKQPVTFTCM